MPLYGYKCGACEHEFTDVMKVDDRKKPCEENCPECGTKGQVNMMIGSPRIVSGVGDFRAKTSSNFRDRLKEIHKQSGKHSTMEV